MRKIRYQEIADALRLGIESGEFGAGQVLPSEATLGRQHEASRVTIRKALELLRGDGLVESRQGFGWMVTARLFSQTLDTLVTIERQLEQTGLDSVRRIIDFGFVDAPGPVVDVLGSRVLEVKRVNLANGKPFCRVTVWCREDLGNELSKTQVAESSFYELLPARPWKATQTIGAEMMSDDDAELLEVPTGGAVLMVRRTSYGEGDEPLLMAEHAFPGHLTEFVVDLQPEGPEPNGGTGLRLVNEN